MSQLFLLLLCVSLVVGKGNFGQDFPVEKCYGENEKGIFADSCPPENTCDNIGVGFACPAVLTYRSHKCVCKDDYYRSPTGKCVNEETCVERYLKSKCGKNEILECGHYCPADKTCETLHQQIKCSLWSQIGRCTYKCACKDGFVRNKDNICVSSETCFDVTA